MSGSQNGIYVHYGSGLCAPESWNNFDASPTVRLQKLPLVGWAFSSSPFRRHGVVVFPSNVAYGDIVKGLPIPKGSCAAIYCSHVIEHLTLDDARIALRNTYSYLREGGIFRFVMPDLEQAGGDYMASNEPDAAHLFMNSTCLGKKSRTRGLEGFVRSWLGNSAHLWMWDYKAIKFELEQVGFRNIRRANFGDSREARFQDVEETERWQECLGVEAEK